MKAFMQNPRTGLPALAVFVTLVLSFAIPPFNSVVAAGSSSSMSSASSSPSVNCDSQFTVASSVTPGDTVRGTLSLNNGCHYIGGVTLSLNGKSLQKNPDQNGQVSASVKTNTDGKTGVLDDPVDVTLNTGRNDIFVTGPAVDPNGSFVRNATIDAFFNLAAPVVVTAPTTIVVTPVTLQTTTGSTGGGSLARTGMNLFALFLLVGELGGQVIPGLTLVLIAGVRVAAEVVVVVPALEVLVVLDHEVDVFAHVRLEDFGGNGAMVGHRHDLADVVAQRRHHDLFVCARPLGARRRLQAVRQLIDGEPVDLVRQHPQEGEHGLALVLLALGRIDTDLAPLLGRGLVHAGERLRHGHKPSSLARMRW